MLIPQKLGLFLRSGSPEPDSSNRPGLPDEISVNGQSWNFRRERLKWTIWAPGTLNLIRHRCLSRTPSQIYTKRPRKDSQFPRWCGGLAIHGCSSHRKENDGEEKTARSKCCNGKSHNCFAVVSEPHLISRKNCCPVAALTEAVLLVPCTLTGVTGIQTAATNWGASSRTNPDDPLVGHESIRFGPPMLTVKTGGAGGGVTDAQVKPTRSSSTVFFWAPVVVPRQVERSIPVASGPPLPAPATVGAGGLPAPNVEESGFTHSRTCHRCLSWR